jgi:hypothetical protein
VSRSYDAPFPPPEFERLYLKQNPDIAEAVAIGAFRSGHHHWSLFGRKEGRSLGWTKADLIIFMANGCGYRTYLEICTFTTGLRYAEIDRSKYQTCHRLMYNCPKDFDDGMPIDFRSVDFDIADCVKQIQQSGLRPDVVLVDPFHDYETSARDLATAIELVGNGGTVVVHDCDPPSEAVASPHLIEGTWCGVTYKAYLDLVSEAILEEIFSMPADVVDAAKQVIAD